MKHLILIFLLPPVLAFGQVRTGKLESGNILLEEGFGFGTGSDAYFEGKFQEADSAFDSRIIQLSIPIDQWIKPNIETFDAITDLAFSDSIDSITVTVNQILQLYWMGYIDGTVNTLEKGKFDREELRSGILSNKQSINSHFRFINQKPCGK